VAGRLVLVPGSSNDWVYSRQLCALCPRTRPGPIARAVALPDLGRATGWPSFWSCWPRYSWRRTEIVESPNVVRSDRDLRGGLGDRTNAAPPPTLTPKQRRRLNRLGSTARLPAELLRVWAAILLGWRPDRCCRVAGGRCPESRDAQILTGCSYLADERPHRPRARVTSNLRDGRVHLVLRGDGRSMNSGVDAAGPSWIPPAVVGYAG